MFGRWRRRKSVPTPCHEEGCPCLVTDLTNWPYCNAHGDRGRQTNEALKDRRQTQRNWDHFQAQREGMLQQDLFEEGA